jgi:universal stress protein A
MSPSLLERRGPFQGWIYSAATRGERRNTMLSIKNIMCPIDFDERSYRALDLAGDLAVRFKASLEVVHVVPDLIGVPEFSSSAADLSAPVREHDLMELSERKLSETVRKHVSRKLPVHRITMHGPTTANIIDIVKREKPDLIVMGARRKKGVFRSLPERIKEETDRPVIMV